MSIENELTYGDYLEAKKLELLDLDKEDLIDVITSAIYKYETDIVPSLISELLNSNSISLETSLEVFDKSNAGCLDVFDLYLDRMPTSDIVNALSERDDVNKVVHQLVYSYPEYTQQLFDELLYYVKLGRIEFDIRQFEE